MIAKILPPKTHPKHTDPQAGVSLLLAILILATVMTIALSIGALMTRELRLSSNVEKSVTAYYAADSCLESGLYQARRGTDGGRDWPRTLNFDNDSRCEAIREQIEDLTGELAQDEMYQVSFVDNQADSVTVDLDLPRDLPDIGPAPWLEYRVISWPEGNFAASAISVSQGLCDPDCQRGEEGLTLPLDAATPGRDFIFRFKPLYNNAAYDLSVAGGAQTVGVYTIRSTGTNRETDRALEVQYSDVAPLNGLFDYVVYSHEELQK